MQQGGGGCGGGGGGGVAGSQSQYGEMGDQSQHQLVEEASPISSRPPATGNLEEFIRMSSGGGGDEDTLASGGQSSGNRWPRQETLALLKIRSDMDVAFRDATVKGPLWEDVSRKLAELGYKRSAKKCKEKFENVHKYYKRTKESRAGRQDGKTYKFFTELEALHSAPAAATHVSAAPPPVAASSVTLDVAPVSVGIPMPVSSARLPPNPSTATMFASPQAPSGSQPPSAPPSFGISFSSNSSSSASSLGSDDDDSEDWQETKLGGESRKRKRRSTKSVVGSTRRMMEFFEGLMKQVIQKQELMQQRFLEGIEKREQDRMIREEAWKRQEMARLAREHELMAQERSIAASRDAAIVSFLQKITGQTIQLPTATLTVPAASTPTPPPEQPSPLTTIPIAVPSHPSPPPSQPQQQQQQQQRQQQHHQQQQQMIRHHHRPQNTQVSTQQQPSIGTEIVMAVPEQQVPPAHEMGGSNIEPTSSRWPKAEVLSLIKLRSGLELRYQEAGPKGLLWEEISAEMLRLGYKRSAKRCKEKWENINKYFKKVKESNKKRPEDAKTCPYFHELDALYRQKVLGGTTTGSSGGPVAPLLGYSQRPEEQSSQQQPQPPQSQLMQTGEQENKNRNNAGGQASKDGLPGSLFEEGSGGAAQKPEDLVRELMEQDHQDEEGQPPFSVDDFDKMEEAESDNMEEDDEEEEDESEEERRMDAYKIEFQRQKGRGNGPPSFLAMVQ